MPVLAERLLHRQDISYGVYVFHMPTTNAMLHLRIGNAAIAMAMTLVLAILSWRFVEQHALRVRK
jgi:peptidoglycan/LPS O-acetylase OafA/YrhL